MTLPKQINPCPINQAVVGIRFNSSLPPDAVFGVVYNKLKDSYKSAEQLPILQIPEAVRNNDSNLLYQPHYKLTRDHFAFQVGPKVISLAVTDQKYTTWESYYEEIQSVFEKIKEIEFISDVVRVGLRYINFFADDIWKNININVRVIENEIAGEEIFLRTVLDRDEYKVMLQAGNQLNLEENNQVVGRASIIDIDTSIEGENINFFEDMRSILEKCHSIEKEIFFGLLKDDFKDSLNPEY
ncbi:MAG: TIGR04255 family protein [Pyrinomonadaceae bacterium]